tara:strand:- start:2594 stop:3379 length:786 start_codon:yes stop_codon:yes gene_type:complete
MKVLDIKNELKVVLSQSAFNQVEENLNNLDNESELSERNLAGLCQIILEQTDWAHTDKYRKSESSREIKREVSNVLARIIIATLGVEDPSFKVIAHINSRMGKCVDMDELAVTIVDNSPYPRGIDLLQGFGGYYHNLLSVTVDPFMFNAISRAMENPKLSELLDGTGTERQLPKSFCTLKADSYEDSFYTAMSKHLSKTRVPKELFLTNRQLAIVQHVSTKECTFIDLFDGTMIPLNTKYPLKLVDYVIMANVCGHELAVN